MIEKTLFNLNGVNINLRYRHGPITESWEATAGTISDSMLVPDPTYADIANPPILMRDRSERLAPARRS